MAELQTNAASDASVVERFIEKAQLAAAVVTEVADIQTAIDYVFNLCEQQGGCRLMAAGCEERLSETAEELCDLKKQKIVAAPGLRNKDFALLQEQCQASGITCIGNGLRNHLAGIDIGFTYADCGFSETGTVVINCPGEDLRLATMISEHHICLLPKSHIYDNSFKALDYLQHSMQKTPDYLAFITGPSRTADIERVLAIGVHGPLELHILLLED